MDRFVPRNDGRLANASHIKGNIIASEELEIHIKARRERDNEVQCAIEDAVEEAVGKAVEKADAQWQGVVADKDAALADQAAALAVKDAALIAQLKAKLGENEMSIPTPKCYSPQKN